MPAISKMRTPIRLLAIPSLTPWRGSLCLRKNARSSSARSSGSRSPAPTTIPLGKSAPRTPAHDPVGGALAGALEELGGAFVHDPRGRELRAADLEADHSLGALR